MVFDPTKTDYERMYGRVEEEFPDAWLEIYERHGRKILKAEPPSGDDANKNAKRIEMFLSKKGLRTNINCLSEDEPEIYEVTATAEHW